MEKYTSVTTASRRQTGLARLDINIDFWGPGIVERERQYPYPDSKA